FDYYLQAIAAQPKTSGLLNIDTKTGEERLWRFLNVRVQEEGREPYILGHAQDVTERERAEENLRISEMFLVDAQRIAHIGSFELDFASGRVKWSEELWRIFGLERQEFGPPLEEFIRSIHPDDGASYR